ncbi:Ig-like domain-containing protein [Sandaracinus amylolyticus]|uniref:Internalin n=1 Tax=Sandaracinus amylolyticus TaxID=927083 RepID=A0A0F6VZG2_9BACT|nr:Ig-like domain-containing protein [Sandaracinus amylolyticus]AKF03542.1 internalin [Sandaracinus amylolyticus]
MSERSLVVGSLASLLVVLSLPAPTASAQTRAATLRTRFDQPGDITFAANSIMTCRAGTGGSGANLCETARASASSTRDDNDYAMVPIDADNGVLPAAEASTTFDSSSSDLVIAPTATVSWAGLYWQCVSSGNSSTPAPDATRRNRVLFRAPGGSYTEVTATVLDAIVDNGANLFQGFADVTATVQSAGAGTYWTGNIQCDSGATNHYGGWTLVVVYRDETEPLRDLVVYDAWRTYNATQIDIDVTGFVTPPSGSVNSRVGVVFYDGDRGSTDTLRLISGTRNTLLGGGTVNPNDNIGNSTITRFGANVTTRTPAYVNTLGYDADLIATVDALPNGATSARIRGQTSGEFIALGVVTFATDIYAPEIDLAKTAVDVNGGQLVPGDVLEYTISGVNSGQDPAIGVVVRDAIPAGTTYVAGSLRVDGAAVTDSPGDDRGEYEVANARIVARVGTGANAAMGGRMNPSDTTTIVFRVRLAPAIPGGTRITNVATATYSGLTLGTGTTFTGSSDGDSGTPGNQPTETPVGAICGDTVITSPETCDDGATANGDGCSAFCRIEVRVVSPDGTTTSSTTPPISGTADPSATVVVAIDGAAVGTVTANAAGAWTFTPATPLAAGAHTIVATATDTGAHVTTDTATVTIDTGTTVAITTPAEGSATSDRTPAISGTGEPGATVVVRVDGNVVGTVTVSAGGTWTVTVGSNLAEGAHTVTASATDAVGHTATDSNTFRVDTATSVAITEPAEGATTSDTTPTIRGTAEPGATVVVSIDGTTIGTVVASAGGTFEVTPTTPLADGAHTATARATDAAGNVATDTSSFTVDSTTFVSITAPEEGDTIASATPTITGTAEPGASVEVTIDGTVLGSVTADASGAWSIVVPSALAQGPHTVVADALHGGATASASATFTVDSTTTVELQQPTEGEIVGTATPTITGTAEPGASIAITIDGAAVGTVTADAEGNWTFVPSTPLGEGTHDVDVVATDGIGNTATDDGSFVVDTSLPSLEIVSPGDETSTASTTPTITGTSEPGLVVTVSIDGALLGSVTTDASGAWSIPVTTPLAEGPHEVVATTTDAAGHAATDENQFTVDTGAPTVTITSPAHGARVPTDAPTITGTADPGATVEVFVDGALVATVTADASGAWSTTAGPLADGSHEVRAVARDDAGNTATATSGFVVDTSTEVAITSPADGGAVGSATPTITGTAEPGASVEVRADGTVIGTVVAGADGTWSIAITTPLAAGDHTIDAHATDSVGNTADATSDFEYDPSSLDTDGDGLSDADECPDAPCRDSDGDGDPDYDDADDDDDGVPTSVECTTAPCADTDGDGTSDHLDTDDDGDGVPTRDEAPGGVTRDTDLDERPDHLDPDDDGDGLPTSDECGTAPCRDSDGDGDADFVDPDDDDDGIPTSRERADGDTHGDDVDGDDRPNWLDTDADGDGRLDGDEGLGDEDGDGTPNYLDPFVPAPDAGANDGDAGTGGDAGVTGGGLAGGACHCSTPGAMGARGNVGLAIAGLLGLALLLRRRRGVIAAVGVGAALASTTTAHAQSQGFTLDPFRAAETPNDGFAVSGVRGLGHLDFGARLVLDYGLDPLVFEERLGDASTQTISVVEHQLVGNLALSLGLFDRVVVFAGLPATFVSEGQDSALGLTADGTTIGDPYLGVRVRLFGEANDVAALALQVAGSAPLSEVASEGQRFAGERGFVFLPRIALEVRPHERVRFAVNVGARLREPSRIVNLEVSHELTYGVGATVVALPGVLDLVAELYGSTGFETFFERESSPLEAIGGVRVHPVCGFNVGLAGGAGLTRGYGAAAFRGVLELSYAYEARCREQPAAAEPLAPPPPSDTDHDGLLDDADQCPNEPEDADSWQDEDGCPDLDNDADGVLDTSDGAPNEPEDRDGFQDEDGVPELDNDADGVPDASDGAPNEPEDRDGFQDADGVPEPDNDRDTLLDPEDECPTAPGRVEDRGCPRAVRLDEASGTIVILQRVEFATNRDTILERSFPILEEVRAVLDANPQLRRVRIEGHTDDRGRDDRNLDLSMRRAGSVMRWLVEHGIDATRLEGAGCGELHPMDSNRTQAGRQLNRRVEFLIVDPPSPTARAAREGCVSVTD